MKTRRRSKLPNPHLQLKMISVFLTAALANLVLFATLMLFSVEVAQTLPGGDARTLVDRIQSDIWINLGLTALILFPLMVGLGVIVTFRVAGPVYRFEKYLSGVALGEEVGPCRIRERDEFHDLCGIINQAVDQLRSPGEPANENAAEELELT